MANTRPKIYSYYDKIWPKDYGEPDTFQKYFKYIKDFCGNGKKCVLYNGIGSKDNKSYIYDIFRNDKGSWYTNFDITDVFDKTKIDVKNDNCDFIMAGKEPSNMDNISIVFVADNFFNNFLDHANRDNNKRKNFNPENFKEGCDYVIKNSLCKVYVRVYNTERFFLCTSDNARDENRFNNFLDSCFNFKNFKKCYTKTEYNNLTFNYKKTFYIPQTDGTYCCYTKSSSGSGGGTIIKNVTNVEKVAGSTTASGEYTPDGGDGSHELNQNLEKCLGQKFNIRFGSFGPSETTTSNVDLGPFGIPNLPDWDTLTEEKKERKKSNSGKWYNPNAHLSEYPKWITALKNRSGFEYNKDDALLFIESFKNRTDLSFCAAVITSFSVKFGCGKCDRNSERADGKVDGGWFNWDGVCNGKSDGYKPDRPEDIEKQREHMANIWSRAVNGVPEATFCEKVFICRLNNWIVNGGVKYYNAAKNNGGIWKYDTPTIDANLKSFNRGRHPEDWLRVKVAIFAVPMIVRELAPLYDMAVAK